MSLVVIENNKLFIIGDDRPELIGKMPLKHKDNSEKEIESLSGACEIAFREAIKNNPNFKIDLFCRPRELR